MSAMQNPHSSSRTMTVISLVVLLGTVAGIGIYLGQHPELFGHIRSLSIGSGLLLFLMSVLMLAGNGLYLRVFAKKFNLDLQAKEWFGLAAVTALGNYLTPLSGGLVARAAYLKRRHNFPYALFLSMLTANYMIAFAVIGVTGIVTLLTLTGTERSSWSVLLFFLATLSMILLVLLVPSTSNGSRHRWLLFVNHAMEGLHAIRRDGALLGKLIAMTFFNITVGALLLFVAFRSTGFSTPFSVALLIYLLTSYTVLINITPGNLGVQEVVTSLAAAILGAGAEAGLLASLVVRAVAILASFTIGPIFSYQLSKELMAASSVTKVDRKEFP
jgi:uncharacterized membrane protein YbhN (UPF0104 family)